MIDKLEFGNVKSLRKSLLIISTLGIFFTELLKYSTGNIEFLGFKIPINQASFLLCFIGYIIVFYILALLIRFSDEEFRRLYKIKLDGITGNYTITFVSPEESKKQLYINKTKWVRNVLKYLVISLDIIFPLVLGIIALIIIF